MVLVLVLILVEEEEKEKERKRKKEKKGRGRHFDYRRTDSSSRLPHPTKIKTKSLCSYSRYLLHNVSSYTYTHFFFPFFKFFLVHFWRCFFLVFNCFRFRAPHSHGPTHPSPGKKRERETDFFPIQSVHKPCLPHTCTCTCVLYVVCTVPTSTHPLSARGRAPACVSYLLG